MRIAYKIAEDGECLTPCPHGMRTPKYGWHIAVGSPACELCEYYAHGDKDNNVVCKKGAA